MQRIIEEAKTEIANLQEEAKSLNDKNDIKANTRARKIKEADLNFAKTRSEELKQEYDMMLEEKATREEEEKFQNMIDAEYDKTEQYNDALNQMYSNMNTLWMQWEMMNPEQQEAQQKKIDFL